MVMGSAKEPGIYFLKSFENMQCFFFPYFFKQMPITKKLFRNRLH